MMSLALACASQVAQEAKSAAVCSKPPSEVGVGIMDEGVRESVGCVRGRK